jgi:hypothetical protein
MSASSNMLFLTLYGKADALGEVTATNASTATFAGAGIVGGHAAGFAVATAVGKGTTAAAPYTDATTHWLADGGYLTGSHTNNISVDVPYGPPASLSFSTTFVTTWGLGGVLSAGPSDYGLL